MFGDFMKTALKIILMLSVLVIGVLYVDFTINSLLGTPRVLVIDYAKEQIFGVLDKISDF